MVVPRLSSVNRRSSVGPDGRGNGIDIAVRQKIEQTACQGSAMPSKSASRSPRRIRRSPEVCWKQAPYGNLPTTTVAVAVTVFPARSVARYVNVYVRSEPPVRSERRKICVSSVPMSAPWITSAGHAA